MLLIHRPYYHHQFYKQKKGLTLPSPSHLRDFTAFSFWKNFVLRFVLGKKNSGMKPESGSFEVWDRRVYKPCSFSMAASSVVSCLAKQNRTSPWLAALAAGSR